jgi:NADPH:quinone reductase-like Zn-dependent oxidoreductase
MPAMRAAVVPRKGPPEVFEVREVPDPVLRRADGVLVRVHATSVNPIDTYLRGGLVPAPLRQPFIPGGDACGIVEAIGDRVRDFAVGDRVFGLRPYIGGDGCYAELALFRERELAEAPANLSDAELASVPLVGLTARQALLDIAVLRAGERVLVHGGSGGVGSFAVQLARACEATVYTTASPRNHDFCRELGAHEVLDYRAGEHRQLRDLDVVFDTIGAYYLDSTPSLRARGGRFVSTTLLGDDERLSPGNFVKHGLRVVASALRSPFGGHKAAAVRVKPDGPGLRHLAGLLESGAIRTHVSHTFPLDQIAEAHRQSQTKRTVGKIVVTIA